MWSWPKCSWNGPKRRENNRSCGLLSSLELIPPSCVHRPSTVSIPARIVSTRRRESLATCSSSTLRSSVTSCETLATESFGRRVARAGRRTLPGASAQPRLLVSGTQTTVAIRLRLNESPCTTTTGRRNPGPDPAAAPGSAHRMSPWLITSPSPAELADPLRVQTHRPPSRGPRTPHRVPA